MKRSIFKKVGEKLSTAYRRCVAFLFPSWCINKKTLKTNINAWDYMPSVKQQLKLVANMSVEQISARYWSAETLKAIFAKNIFWSNMSEMEFYNLLSSKEAIKQALSDPNICFSETQMRTLINSYGLSKLQQISDVCTTKLNNFINLSLSLGHTDFSYLFPNIINDMPEAYCFMLRNHFYPKPTVPADILLKMLDYFFKNPTSEQYKNQTSALAEAYGNWNQRSRTDEFVWLSYALHNLDNKDVFKKVLLYLDNIMTYIKENEDWQEELLNALMSKDCNFETIAKIYNLYPKNENRQQVFLQALETAKNIKDVCKCYKVFENIPNPTEEIRSKIIDKIIASVSEKYGRKTTTNAEALLLLNLFPFENWSQTQKESAIRALSAGKYLSDEYYVRLADTEKKVALEEMELFSQFDLIAQTSKRVIADKIKLIPEAESYFFSIPACCNLWEEYINLYQISDLAYATLVHNAAASETLLLSHAQKYGLTEWQYRTIMNSFRSFSAPKLKGFMTVSEAFQLQS